MRALNRNWNWTYNSAGYNTSVQAPNGAQVGCGYDAIGRLTSVPRNATGLVVR